MHKVERGFQGENITRSHSGLVSTILEVRHCFCAEPWCRTQLPSILEKRAAYCGPMTSDSKWHEVVRLVWIAGGVVAVNEPGPIVQIRAGMAGHSICRLHIETYASLFEVLRQKGFPLLGATFVLDQAELQGLRAPEFRVVGPSRGWPVWEITQKWRQIAFAAGKSGHMLLMDVASRVASGFRYSQMRLHDLVTAYSTQLRGHLHESEPRDYQAFQDTNSFEVFKAIHAMFWEMAVLRDTLAEFAAAFCFSQAGVKSLKGLRKALKSSAVPDPLASEILRASDESAHGWLAIFTLYRNFFTHVAPMEQALGIAFAVQDMRVLPGGLAVPQLYYALPGDITDLTRKRSKGMIFTSLKELGAASSRRHNRILDPDALDYLHGCINLFAELSGRLLARSPVPPKPIRIGPEDMIGGIRAARK